MAKKKLGGIAGIWLDDHELVAAAHKVRQAGYKKFDAITPFPVHGIEEAIGIERSKIPWITFFAGVLGLSCGLALTVWTMAVDWALNIGGKPFVSLPAFVPIMFELTILFAALFSVGGLFHFARLPKIDPPIIDPDLTSHKFAIFIPENDVNYDAARAEQLLRSLGAKEVKRVAEY
ncbi:MAG: DUF3341 domain-containing protein [Bdellovibrionota bacterium]